MSTVIPTHPNPRPDWLGRAARAVGWIVAGMAVGFVLLVLYALLTIDLMLFCTGGIAESDGPALAVGIVLWLGFAGAVATSRRRGAALGVYALSYATSLLVLGLASEAIWGPRTCSGIGF